jgi:ABC-type transporter Mla subunit MlaD
MSAAGRPLVFEFITGLRKFMPGIRTVQTELGEVSDDLKDVGDAGDALEKSLEQSLDGAAGAAKTSGAHISSALDDALDGAGDDAKRAGERLERGLKQGLDGAADQARKGGRRIGRELDRGMQDAGENARENAKEVGAEFAENAGEGFRSGDFGGVITESLTSLTNSLTGAGGIAAALGIGTVTALINAWKQRQEELRDVGRESGRTLAEGLQDGMTAADYQAEIVNRISEVLGDGGFAELQKNLSSVGITMDDFVDAVRDGGPRLDEMQQKLVDLAGGDWEANMLKNFKKVGLTPQEEALKGLLIMLDDNKTALAAAGDEAKAYYDALNGRTKDTKQSADALQKVADKAKAAADAARLAGDAWVYMSAEEKKWRKNQQEVANGLRIQADSWAALTTELNKYRDASDKVLTAASRMAGAVSDGLALTPRAHTRPGRKSLW